MCQNRFCGVSYQFCFKELKDDKIIQLTFLKHFILRLHFYFKIAEKFMIRGAALGQSTCSTYRVDGYFIF